MPRVRHLTSSLHRWPGAFARLYALQGITGNRYGSPSSRLTHYRVIAYVFTRVNTPKAARRAGPNAPPLSQNSRWEEPVRTSHPPPPELEGEQCPAGSIGNTLTRGPPNTMLTRTAQHRTSNHGSVLPQISHEIASILRSS